MCYSSQCTLVVTVLTCIYASLYRAAIGASDLSSFRALGPLDHNELDRLSIPHTTKVLLGVVLNDGGLRIDSVTMTAVDTKGTHTHST